MDLLAQFVSHYHPNTSLFLAFATKAQLQLRPATALLELLRGHVRELSQSQSVGMVLGVLVFDEPQLRQKRSETRYNVNASIDPNDMDPNSGTCFRSVTRK